MKFAISLFQSQTSGQSERTIYCQAIEQTKLAEALGFHAVWFTEQHFNDFGTCPDPLTFAAHMAGITKTIRLGSGVVLLSLHNPVVVVERAALVDQLSEGRLDLGIGKGHANINYSAFDLDFEKDEARFFEAHDLLKTAWSGEEFSYHGKFFDMEKIRIVPRPSQSPHPPLWVATFGNPSIIEFAAHNAYPLLTTFSGDGLKKYMDLYRSQYSGTAAPTISVSRAIHLHQNSDQARREMHEPARWYIDNNPGRPSRIINYELAIDEYFNKLGIIGSVDECIERIEYLRREHHVDYLVCVFGLGGLAPEKIMASMRLFAEKVMPNFVE
ncbi:MAG: LLM class flavin-dependent oxidoreductase [Chloroflexota bacterium]